MAKRFDDWEVIRDLPQGGQAWTYLVKKAGESDEGVFVLKRLIKKSDPNRLKRFQQEIDAGLHLSHPNVLKAVGHNITHEHPYFVTEYCSGGALADASIDDYSDVERLRLFLAICHGVGHAHANGVIHRDLKPANIFLLSDLRTPVVGDFGLCLLADQQERLTEVNEAVGARWYMAPELEDGINLEVHTEADIYSLGKILYWLLSGGKIFSREKHRISQYDLTLDRKDAGIFFVYDLLDGMIEADLARRRFKEANEVAAAVETVIRRIEVNAHHLDLSVPQACTYCGLGSYQKILDESPETNRTGQYPELERFGLRGIGKSSWLILACNYCGNVQVFRLDYAENKNIWKKGRPEG
jgi:serine/threonine protein kinase